MTIPYRWHALHGRPRRIFYSEKRRGADVVLVEGEHGVGVMVAAWLLDPAACAMLTFGDPRVSTAALCDLSRLLAWAILATFIELCKLLDLEPNAYLTDLVTRLVNGHPQSRLAELTPWGWKAACTRTKRKGRAAG